MTSSVQAIDAIARALTGDVSWIRPGRDASAFADLAVHHGVEALLWEALQKVDGDAAEIRRCLDPRVRTAVAGNLLAQRELQTTLSALASGGVPALPIKGVALAFTVYEHPWHRPRVDSDLLCAPGALDAARRVLEERGYRRSDAVTSGIVVTHQIAYEKVDVHGAPHVIDLHWKIVNPHVVSDALAFEELWARRQPAPALGPQAAVPGLVDSVLLASIHRLAHHQGNDRLIWLYDLRLLTLRLTDTDWTALVERSRSRAVAGLCLDALRQARLRLGAPLPGSIERALEDVAPSEASHRYLEGPIRKIDVLASDLRTLPSWGARLRLLLEHAFPPAAFMRKRYGVKSPLLLPALYLHRLVVGAAKWVRP